MSHRRSDWLESSISMERLWQTLDVVGGRFLLLPASALSWCLRWDSTLPRLQFLGEQLRLEGVGNVVPIHCDAFDLPIPNASLDLVFLIGLLDTGGAS